MLWPGRPCSFIVSVFAGAYYSYVGDGQEEKLGQGRDAVVRLLEKEENAAFLKKINDQSLEALRAGAVRQVSSDADESDADDF